MPLYIGDYLKKTQRLQAEQHGAYLLLLMEAWQSGGSVPDDPEELASIARVPLDRWQTHTSAKVLPFFTHRDGRYWSGRVCEELARATSVIEKRSQAGAAGAAARWQNDGKRMANAMASESQNDAPSPSHTSSSLRSEEERAGAAQPAKPKRQAKPRVTVSRDELLALGINADDLDSWLARRGSRSPVTKAVLADQQREAEAAGLTLPQAIAYAAGKGWLAFNAGYYANARGVGLGGGQRQQADRPLTPYQRQEEAGRQAREAGDRAIEMMANAPPGSPDRQLYELQVKRGAIKPCRTN